MSWMQAATDDSVVSSGSALSRPTNIVDECVASRVLSLKEAAPGQPVDIGTSRPLDMIKQTAVDFVAVYNQMKASLSAAANLSGTTMALRQLESTQIGRAHV